MLRSFFTAACALLFSALFSCKKESSGTQKKIKAEVFAASGAVQTKMDEFRALLGPLNTSPDAPSANGRREINWDGVPDNLLHQKLPADFFNPVGNDAPVARQRGLAYDAAGNFQVSNTGFAPLNAGAATEFAAFSGNKVFANVASAQWEISFQKPGQTIPAKIKGFGAVFSDVDLDASASIEFFDGTESLGTFPVPKKENGRHFSFLGVYFPEREITRVKIAHKGKLAGNTNDVSNGGTDDLIVLDDFIYSEPR